MSVTTSMTTGPGVSNPLASADSKAFGSVTRIPVAPIESATLAKSTSLNRQTSAACSVGFPP